MNKNEHINNLIEEALNSVDGAKRAEPMPYLLTRINARMSKETVSAWEKAGWFIGRPAVALAGLCLIILINVMVLMINRPTDTVAVSEQVMPAQTDEFSYTVATIYDNENTQP